MKFFFENSGLALGLFLLIFLSSCNVQSEKTPLSTTTKSEIILTEEGYQLLLDGEPFYIKGAGLGGNGSIESLAKHGANASRTWSTEKGREVLDKAHELGLKVMMGIWVGLERHGFDYNDEKAVKQQLESIREKVLALKDHPALMIWGIGNEMNHQSGNPKVWDAVNDISKMIHEVDPYHLTTTCLAGIGKREVDLVLGRSSDLDFLSIQLYGPMDILPKLIEESGYDGPLLVTEWGATGYWEVGKTEWNAPLENNSSLKADLYLSRYQNSIESQSQQIIGSFVFLWGQKQERTPTWFGMFMPDGNETESVDMMHYAWNGEWPENRSPRLNDFTLNDQRAVDNIKLKAGNDYSANVEVTDPDNDTLSYRWEIMRESNSQNTGGDAEYVPPVINNAFIENGASTSTFKAPDQEGAYRLFIYVEDGNFHTAHANIPFWVEGSN
ncbi:MAG: glycoside hydrolase family 2 TIM barrel-domain containing protein [Bacteroidota bacterium]